MAEVAATAWVKDYASYAPWSPDQGEIVRLTQDGRLRLTEDGLHYRITRRAPRSYWVRDALPSDQWARM